mmetsp:Transcript_93664/g.227570  ORF Transcript_93664/g.227570 Transcript_93664/m.227570 type:complete len:271 (-) Transcript_93664:82-894(-)
MLEAHPRPGSSPFRSSDSSTHSFLRSVWYNKVRRESISISRRCAASIRVNTSTSPSRSTDSNFPFGSSWSVKLMSNWPSGESALSPPYPTMEHPPTLVIMSEMPASKPSRSVHRSHTVASEYFLTSLSDIDACRSERYFAAAMMASVASMSSMTSTSEVGMMFVAISTSAASTTGSSPSFTPCSARNFLILYLADLVRAMSRNFFCSEIFCLATAPASAAAVDSPAPSKRLYPPAACVMISTTSALCRGVSKSTATPFTFASTMSRPASV